MTEKNNNVNDLLASLEKIKTDFKNSKDCIKDKNNLINKGLEIAFNLFNNHKDKGGFLRLLFDYEKNKGWSKPSVFKKDITDYFNFCEIDFYFNVKSQKLFLDFNPDNVINFLEYKEKIKEINKDDKEKKVNDLLKVKLPFKIDNLTLKELDSLILKASLMKKELVKKEKTN